MKANTPKAGDVKLTDSAALLRHRFSRAATTYDQYADIQLQALELLMAQFQAADEPALILELGCGTGNYTRRLLTHFPRTRLLSLDFSEAMLLQAREKINELAGDYAHRLTLLCQDGESFLATNSTRFDLITANATLQWFVDLPRALALIKAGLQPQGLLLTTIFGRRSLEELKKGLQAVLGEEMRVAASRFPDYPELRAMLSAVFSEVEISEHQLSRHFASLAELLRHFRYTGTGGNAKVVGFSPRHYRELSRWFNDNYDGFPAIFQVLVVRCRN